MNKLLKKFKYKLRNFYRRHFMSKLKEPFTYVIVRTDMPVVNQIVQGGHALQDAAIELIPKGEKSGYNIWLQVADKEALVEAMEKLSYSGVPYVDYIERDYPKGLTAIATGLLWTQKDREAFKGYDLLTPIPAPEVIVDK
jgi:hypothetical protein